MFLVYLCAPKKILMDYGIVIEKIHQELKAYWGKGKVADYIPALAEVEPKRYGRT